MTVPRTSTVAKSKDKATRLAGSLSLVLPAHNEADNIQAVVNSALATLPKYADQFEIIVVDDGSKDATGDIADHLALDHPEVKVIHHSRNRGYGGALKSGFAASTGDWVMFMDADRQFDIEDLRYLVPLINNADIVAGFRMQRQDPLHRRIFAESFNMSVRLLFGVHLRDIDCAFKLFRGDLIRAIDFSSSGALINTEIQAKAKRMGARLQQVGVHHYPRVAGESSGGNPKVILRAMRETLALRAAMRYWPPPQNWRSA